MNKHRWFHAALIAVLMAAAFFRFGGITSVGIRFDDEGAYVGDARLWHRCARVATDVQSVSAVMQGDKAALQKRMSDIGVDFAARYAKPSQGYTFLGAATMFVAGDRPAALLLLNAAAGTLAVLLVYAIGSALFTRPIGLCAALLLAVSPYHLFYCRSAFADATTGLFALAGIWIWIAGSKRGWPPRRTYLLAGILLGYAATCHYRALYLPGVVILADILLTSWRRRSDDATTMTPRTWIRRWGWLAAGTVTPALAIELIFRTARAAAWASDSFLPVDTFFESAWAWIQLVLATGEADAARGRISALTNVTAYAGYLIHWHGVAAVLIALVGLLIVIRRPGNMRVPALLVLVSLVLLINQPYAVARALSLAVPMICVCAAVAIVTIANLQILGRSGRLVIAPIVLVLCVAPALPRAYRMIGQHSAVADAAVFIETRGRQAVAIGIDTYHQSKYWLYLERANVEVVNEKLHKWGSPKDATARLRSRGVRWVIIDPQRWHFRDAPPGPRNRVFDWWETMDDHLRQEAVLAAEFDHLDNDCWTFLAEGPGLDGLEEMNRRHAGRIRIYDLGAGMSLTERS